MKNIHEFKLYTLTGAVRKIIMIITALAERIVYL